MIGLVSSVVVIAVGFLLVGRQPQMGAVPNVQALPAVNAWLDRRPAPCCSPPGTASFGKRRVSAHKTCMLTAFGVSSCFLVLYVIYHYHAGSKPFGGHGVDWGIYYPLLISTSSSPP